MKNANIDNSISAQNVILWQYDHAANFIKLVTLIEQIFVDTTEAFWNEYMSVYDSVEGAVSNIDVASDYGLAVWGVVLGVRRPIVTQIIGGIKTSHPIDRELYRDVLKARFVLSLSGSDAASINTYLLNAYRAGLAKVYDNYDMTLTYAYSDPPNWATNTAYKVGDKVKSSNSYYRCTQNHTSSGAAIDATKFIDVTSRHNDEAYLFSNQSDYATYFPAGVRDNSSCSYKFFSFAGQWLPPFANITKKYSDGEYTSSVKDWTAGTYYEVRDLVRTGTNPYAYYLCKVSHRSGTAIDTDKFAIVTSQQASYANPSSWASGTSYSFGTIVKTGSASPYSYFLCLNAHTSSSSGTSPDTGTVSAYNFNSVDKGTFFDSLHWEFAGYGYSTAKTYSITFSMNGSTPQWTLTATGGQEGVQSETVNGRSTTYLNEMWIFFPRMNIIASWCAKHESDLI